MQPKKMESDKQQLKKPHRKPPGPEPDLHRKRRALQQPCPQPRRGLLRAS